MSSWPPSIWPALSDVLGDLGEGGHRAFDAGDDDRQRVLADHLGEAFVNAPVEVAPLLLVVAGRFARKAAGDGAAIAVSDVARERKSMVGHLAQVVAHRCKQPSNVVGHHEHSIAGAPPQALHQHSRRWRGRQSQLLSNRERQRMRFGHVGGGDEDHPVRSAAEIDRPSGTIEVGDDRAGMVTAVAHLGGGIGDQVAESDAVRVAVGPVPVEWERDRHDELGLQLQQPVDNVQHDLFSQLARFASLCLLPRS